MTAKIENGERLVHAFSMALGVDSSLITDDLRYQGISEWDSITHMFLISELEGVFGIEIDPDDILEMITIGNVKRILLKNNIEF